MLAVAEINTGPMLLYAPMLRADATVCFQEPHVLAQRNGTRTSPRVIGLLPIVRIHIMCARVNVIHMFTRARRHSRILIGPL